MDALIIDQGSVVGVPFQREFSGRAEDIEGTYRRLVGLIATTEEFALR